MSFQQVRNGFLYTDLPTPDIRTMGDLLRYRATATPDKKFLVWAEDGVEHSITFGVFFQVAVRLACKLNRIFHDPSHIAVIGENSRAWVTVYEALLSSNHTAILPAFNLPAAPLSKILKRTQCRAAFLTLGYPFAAELKDLCPDIVFYDLTPESIETLIADEVFHADYEPATDSEKSALMHITSGTTGEPKCVVLTQKNIFAVTNGTHAIGFYTDVARVTTFPPLFHAFGRVSLDLAVYDGVEFSIAGDMRRAPEYLMQYRPDIILSIPAMLPTLLAMPEIPIKKAIIAGAASNPAVLGQLRERGVIPLNAYGMSETGATLSGNLPFKQKDASVGCAPNCPWEFKVTEQGELCVRGDLVMKEYWNDPKATSEAIRDGWLHTGDLAHIDEDGFIFLTGRCKNLIILGNGENVSPEALENKIGALPGVKEVVIVERSGKIFALIYAPGVDERELRHGITGINRDLPSYERIQKIELRSEPFPRSIAGKISRKDIR